MNTPNMNQIIKKVLDDEKIVKYRGMFAECMRKAIGINLEDAVTKLINPQTKNKNNVNYTERRNAKY